MRYAFLHRTAAKPYAARRIAVWPANIAYHCEDDESGLVTICFAGGCSVTVDEPLSRVVQALEAAARDNT